LLLWRRQAEDHRPTAFEPQYYHGGSSGEQQGAVPTAWRNCLDVVTSLALGEVGWMDQLLAEIFLDSQRIAGMVSNV
jgi:hypothetical protein